MHGNPNGTRGSCSQFGLREFQQQRNGCHSSLEAWLIQFHTMRLDFDVACLTWMLHILIGTEDRWAAFCNAAHLWKAKRQAASADEPIRGRRKFTAISKAAEKLRIWGVQSGAGGFAQRCNHYDSRLGSRCGNEIAFACLACCVPLCAEHSGPLNVKSPSEEQQRMQSRCHEHNRKQNNPAHTCCPCQDCVKMRAR